MKYAFRIFARRSDSDGWTIWTSTSNADVCDRQIQIIESYGWQWKVR